MRISILQILFFFVHYEIYAELTSKNSSEQAIEKARRCFKANKEAIINIDELSEKVKQISTLKAVFTTFANFATVSGVLLPIFCPLYAPYANRGTIAGGVLNVGTSFFAQRLFDQENIKMHDQVLKEVIEEQPFFNEFFYGKKNMMKDMRSS
jgi:hypothetical protein